jgi:two-component system chemotaxis sensor kinase CheA
VPSDAAIVHLIFEAGFSTATQVTNLSGRGVGMDVVRRNIESLRGSVNVTSVEGAGSTVEIRLPLTLAIIDGFLMAVGSSKFIVPLESVVEVIEGGVARERLGEGGRTCIELRGQVLPVISVRSQYDLDGDVPVRSSVIVVREGGRRFGLQVDQLLCQHQTVIKPLGRMFRNLRGISGSSILANGEVALILDVKSFHELACADTATRSAAQRAGGAPAPLQLSNA